jgi:hypothetical protein
MGYLARLASRGMNVTAFWRHSQSPITEQVVGFRAGSAVPSIRVYELADIPDDDVPNDGVTILMANHVDLLPTIRSEDEYKLLARHDESDLLAAKKQALEEGLTVEPEILAAAQKLCLRRRLVEASEESRSGAGPCRMKSAICLFAELGKRPVSICAVLLRGARCLIMPFSLLKFGLNKDFPFEQVADLPSPTDLKSHYDVVIIGGGGHGVATAYYLAKYHGITNIAVLEKAYLGGGNTARNTAVIRSNYLTSAGVRFYTESVKLYERLSNEFDFNIMYSQRGQLTLAHTDATVRAFRQRAEVNKHFGGRTELIDRQAVGELVPSLNLDPAGLPILAGLWHLDGATARHDAVAVGLRQGRHPAWRRVASADRSHGRRYRSGARHRGANQSWEGVLRLRGAGRFGPQCRRLQNGRISPPDCGVPAASDGDAAREAVSRPTREFFCAALLCAPNQPRRDCDWWWVRPLSALWHAFHARPERGLDRVCGRDVPVYE